MSGVVEPTRYAHAHAGEDVRLAERAVVPRQPSDRADCITEVFVGAVRGAQAGRAGPRAAARGIACPRPSVVRAQGLGAAIGTVIPYWFTIGARGRAVLDPKLSYWDAKKKLLGRSIVIARAVAAAAAACARAQVVE